MDGLYATMGPAPYLDEASQPIRFWANKYKTKFNEDPTVFSAYGYQIIDAFAQASKAGANLTPTPSSRPWTPMTIPPTSGSAEPGRLTGPSAWAAMFAPVADHRRTLEGDLDVRPSELAAACGRRHGRIIRPMSPGYEWLEVEWALDLEAQGVAHRAQGRRRRWCSSKAPCRASACRPVSRKKNNWEQGRGHGHRARKQPARAPLPALRPARRRLRRLQMQHLHPAAQVAVKQRVLRTTCWHLGKVKPGRVLRPIEGDRPGATAYRAAVGAPRARRARCWWGFHERKVALRGRHVRLSGAAAARERACWRCAT